MLYLTRSKSFYIKKLWTRDTNILPHIIKKFQKEEIKLYKLVANPCDARDN